MEKEKVLNIIKKAVSFEKGKEVAIAKEILNLEKDVQEVKDKVDTFLM